jgi:alpha,alpha-trehalose phosphorylase
MLPRDVVPLPSHVYPPDPWRIVETRFDRAHLDRAETVFSLGNGFLGFRGTFEEGRPSIAPGTFVNGFHETWPIHHAEEAYGFARTGQTIVNVPDATVIELYVDDEPLVLPEARLPSYERVLDFRAGTLTRELDWSTPAGKQVHVSTRRLVSFEHRHLAAIEYEVTVTDRAAPLTLVSKVVNRQDVEITPRTEAGEEAVPDPRVARTFPDRVLNTRVRRADGHRLCIGYETSRSRMTLGLGVDHVIETRNPCEVTQSSEDDVERMAVMVDAQPGVPVRITKYITYQISRSVPPGELVARCQRTLDRAVRDGFGALCERQRDHLAHFWDRADVQLDVGDGTPNTQQAVRWNLYQLAQASWRAEGSGIPAKGLTGQAYEGHYFWDTEIYILPFLAYTQPRIARNLLRFRYGMLDHARRRARELSTSGALFPWRTINGEEASAYYQAGTAQYHIDADIIYALRRYVDVRGDPDFHLEMGAELVIETARLWADLGFYGERGAFHIHAVTGPDEYTTVVDDNAFTNLMARFNLRYATRVVRDLERDHPEEFALIAETLGLEQGEVEDWERAAEAMHIPYDEGLGIHPQDARFLEREPWDLKATTPDRFPLLLHYHPLVIYRYQVIKQADVVLALFLLSDEFSLEQKRRDFAYYDPLTTGDSSLSAAVQSIVAAETGNEDKAREYFEYALMMDLADLAGNAADGVHVASAGGVWQALVFGFGGVRDTGGHLSLDAHLPGDWRRLAFSLRFQDRQIRVRLEQEREVYLLEEGEPLEVTVRGTGHVLRAGEPLELATPEA